jgi:hypothetical protein
MKQSAMPFSDWANESHATPVGFTRLADQKWLPALQAAGLAA